MSYLILSMITCSISISFSDCLPGTCVHVCNEERKYPNLDMQFVKVNLTIWAGIYGIMYLITFQLNLVMYMYGYISMYTVSYI